jgi:hypothetical protein
LQTGVIDKNVNGGIPEFADHPRHLSRIRHVDTRRLRMRTMLSHRRSRLVKLGLVHIDEDNLVSLAREDHREAAT